jgi:hypothetical protein
MSPRHAGPVRASDSWLADQINAWVADFDAYSARVAAGAGRCRSESQEDLIFRVGWMLDEQGRLLGTIRQLVEEVRGRDGSDG